MAVLSQLLLNVSNYSVSKKSVVRRLWSALPCSGLWEACSWAYDKLACPRDRVTIPLGKKPLSGPEDNSKVATAVFLIGKLKGCP